MNKIVITIFLGLTSLVFATDKKEELKFEANINEKKQLVILVKRDNVPPIVKQGNIGTQLSDEEMKTIEKEVKKINTKKVKIENKKSKR